MRAACIALALLALAGCRQVEPEATQGAGNGYRVSRLFTHEGCTVYRFTDDARYRYFTRCDGAASASTSWDESSGKVSREMQIPTSNN